jgi:hypothetical protein
MTYYKRAYQDIKDFNCKKVKLTIGNKVFEGVEFSPPLPDDFTKHDGSGYEKYLLIHCKKQDVSFLDDVFSGEGFVLYGESCGHDFIFMGKVENKPAKLEVEE